MLSLCKQLEHLQDEDPELRIINRETYRNYIISEKIASYGKFTIGTRTGDSVENQSRQAIVFRFLVEFLEGDFDVLFFDTSTVGPDSFRRKAWLGKTGPTVFRMKRSFKTLKIFACSTLNGLLCLRVFNRSSGEIIGNFLEQAIQFKRATSPKNKRIVIFLDNATAHRSPEVVNLAQKCGIYLLYNAIETPCFNLVEGCFEFLKRDLRLNSFQSDYQTIEKILLRAKNYNKYQAAISARKEAGKILKILSGNQSKGSLKPI